MNPIRSIIVLALLALAFVSTSLAQTQTKPNRNLLFIGQSKGYQHEHTATEAGPMNQPHVRRL